MKTYKITGRTNSYIAQRDINFNGKTEIVIKSVMTLKEAQQELLQMFNQDYDTYYKNWGIAASNNWNASKTREDGTRSYEYDSRYYSIEECLSLEEIADMYNDDDDDTRINIEEIVEQNGYISDCFEEFGICHSDTEKVVINDEGIAFVTSI